MENKTNLNRKQKTKKLIILGNGFDLAGGLKTSIFDFYDYYIKNNYNNFRDEVYFKINFLCFLCIHCNTEQNDALKKFLKVNNANDWKDFELILNHVLLDGAIYRKIENIYNGYLKDRQYDSSDTVERLISSYISRYFEYNYRNAKDSFLGFLEFEVNKFEEEFRNYLTTIDVGNEILAKKKLLLNEIKGNYDSINVIFNYTRQGFTDCNPNTNFAIHGTTGAKNNIIGIDPSANEEFKNCSNVYEELGDKIKFTKTYKRLERVCFRQEFVLRDDIGIVTFYGHSLGEQDYSYFQSIFDHYSLYDGKLILEFCYSEYDDENPTAEYGRLLKRITKLINKYGETLDNKDHGKNLLHKLMLEGRIKVRKLDISEIITEDKISKLLENRVD